MTALPLHVLRSAAAEVHSTARCTLTASLRPLHDPHTAVTANAMVALGLMLGTRVLAFLVLLVMHHLKRI